MIHSLRFTCVLDTNVIYPIDIRDLLFWFASYDLFTPKWSKHIFSEWENVMKRKHIPDEEIKKRISAAQRAFPDALIENYETLVDSLKLPDEKEDGMSALTNQYAWLAAKCKSLHDQNKVYLHDDFWKFLRKIIVTNKIYEYTPSIIKQLQDVSW
jgi:hypothetical protein